MNELRHDEQVVVVFYDKPQQDETLHREGSLPSLLLECVAQLEPVLHCHLNVEAS